MTNGSRQQTLFLGFIFIVKIMTLEKTGTVLFVKEAVYQVQRYISKNLAKDTKGGGL